MPEISLSKARSIVRSVIKKGREMEFQPLAVVVLDTGGHVKAFEREDGASPGRFDMARGKAYGAVMTGMPGSVLKARAEEQAYFVTALNGVFGGQCLPVPGGVIVKDSRDRVIGAVGVSGDNSDNDAIAAMAGVEDSGLSGLA
ncbi:heme-binding protein [Rhodobacteraceae bacterium]|nr:heme-binding protein [Paracoccaceae bacterium]